MSLSLIEERQRRLLTILNDGFPVFAISGAEPEEKPKEGEEKPDEKDKEGEGSENPDAPRTTYSAAEYEQVLERMKAADRNRATLQSKVEEFENASRSELEKAQAELKKATERADTAEREAVAAKMGREFLKFPGYDWHDPDTALALVDLTDVKFDDAGKVQGMKEAVDKLAKAKPFLLKSKEKDDDKPDGKPSGHTPEGRPKVKQERREELATKYRL